jgi:hypothetical protein
MLAMKISWIAAAERSFPFVRDGALGRMLRLLDGSRNWHPISTAPFNHDLEVRVADDHAVRVIPFPCRQTTDGWINTDLGVHIDMEPSEWRDWPEERADRAN